MLISFFVSCLTLTATTPLHETTHWILSYIDPYIEPVEIHLFSHPYNLNGKHILSSKLGYVVVRERYPNALKDRPPWIDMLQEIISISIQITITLFILLVTLEYLIKTKKCFL
ncbi:MAG: hypothetical protein DRN05_00805 [Thermoplasmata archaeon]|nr:MAG: hypothetical protein DRN05_00805 [Thermoplasmata archaeon]